MPAPTFPAIVSAIAAFVALCGNPVLVVGGLLLHLYLVVSAENPAANVSLAAVLDAGIKVIRRFVALPECIALKVFHVGSVLLPVLLAHVNGARRDPVSAISAIAVATGFCLRVACFVALLMCTVAYSVTDMVLRLVFLLSTRAIVVGLCLALHVLDVDSQSLALGTAVGTALTVTDQADSSSAQGGVGTVPNATALGGDGPAPTLTDDETDDELIDQILEDLELLGQVLQMPAPVQMALWALDIDDNLGIPTPPADLRAELDPVFRNLHGNTVAIGQWMTWAQGQLDGLSDTQRELFFRALDRLVL